MTRCEGRARWSRRRLRFDAHINPPKAQLDLPDDAEVSFVPMDAVGQGDLRLSDTRPLDEVHTGYTYFANGDVCVAKITPCFENGKGALAQGLVNGVGFGTTELHVIRPLGGLDARFLFYVTAAQDFRAHGESEMYGTGGQKRVPERFLKDWCPDLPSLETQQRIVRFLDAKTTLIDGLIEKKRALLDRLEEKRQALISRAVTKGLDSNAPMKPSGIDWFGDIPGHWEVVSLRRIAGKVATGRTPPSAASVDYFTNGTINWFTPGDFGDGIDLQESARKIVPEALDDGVAIVFPKGTVCLVGIGATLGKVAVSTSVGSANQQLNAVVLGPHDDPYYVAYLLHALQDEVRMLSNASTLGILNQSKTKSFLVLRPPSREQKAIAEFLRTRDSHNTSAIEGIQKSIVLLCEYRSALITLAVIGRLEGLQ